MRKAPIIIASGVHLPLNKIAEYLGPRLKYIHAISCKGTTFEPRVGNEPPRLTSVGPWMANSVGLQNPGLIQQITWMDEFRRKRPWMDLWLNLYDQDIPKAVEYFGSRKDGIKQVVSAIEVNCSCPNVDSEDLSLSNLKLLRQAFTNRIYLKVGPLFFSRSKDKNLFKMIAPLNDLVDGFVVSNTLPTAVKNFTPMKFQRDVFGLSGPFLLGHNMETIRVLRRVTKKTIIACGGIAHMSHVINYFDCGANYAEVAITCFWDPHLPLKWARRFVTKGLY